MVGRLPVSGAISRSLTVITIRAAGWRVLGERWYATTAPPLPSATIGGSRKRRCGGGCFAFPTSLSPFPPPAMAASANTRQAKGRPSTGSAGDHLRVRRRLRGSPGLLRASILHCLWFACAGGRAGSSTSICRKRPRALLPPSSASGRSVARARAGWQQATFRGNLNAARAAHRQQLWQTAVAQILQAHGVHSSPRKHRSFLAAFPLISSVHVCSHVRSRSRSSSRL